MNRIILGMAALALALGACTAAERQNAIGVAGEACAIDRAAQPIIVPIESAIGLAMLPAAPVIAVGHIAAGIGCAVIQAQPGKPAG